MKSNDVLYQYYNGNTQVTLYKDGSRTLEYTSVMDLEYPLNIDIRVSTSCSFGKRADGTYVLCDFCHEEALVEGVDCDYNYLHTKLKGLPRGIELAIGCNAFTEELLQFVRWCTAEGYVCNLTVNQGHCKRDFERIYLALLEQSVLGLGISYRSSLPFNVPKELVEYPNTVFHCISGIDKIESVLSLQAFGVTKLLILGEKDFGANKDRVFNEDLDPWVWNLPLFLKAFPVLSFDNLALAQLDVKRLFVNQRDFDVFNQEEHSFYIDAAQGFMAPSSRNPQRTPIDKYSVRDYFQRLKSRRILL